MRIDILRMTFVAFPARYRLVLRALLSTDRNHVFSPFPRAEDIRRLDHRPGDSEGGEAKRHRTRRSKRRLDLTTSIASDVLNRDLSRRPKSSDGHWDALPDRPNPIAPHAYIDFRRLTSPEEISLALKTSRDFLQMRQLVAAMTRLTDLKTFVSPEMLDDVVDMAEKTMGSTSVDDTVGMMLACARFKLSHRCAFLGRLSRLAIDRGYVKDMTMRELATTATSCAGVMRQWHLNHRDASSADKGFRRLDGRTGGQVRLGDVEVLLTTVIEELCCFREVDEEFEHRTSSILMALKSIREFSPSLNEWIEALSIKRG